MTREEAIDRIKNHKIAHRMNEPRAIYISEALDMAIQALEQEPCEEMISKKAIIDKLQTNEASDYFGSVICAAIIDFINDEKLIIEADNVEHDCCLWQDGKCVCGISNCPDDYRCEYFD